MIFLQNIDNAPHIALFYVLTGVSESSEKGLISNVGSVGVATRIPVAHIRSVLTAVKERREKIHPDIYTWKINGFQWLTIGPLTVTNDPGSGSIKGFDYVISLLEKHVAS